MSDSQMRKNRCRSVPGVLCVLMLLGGVTCSKDEPYDPEYAWKHVHYLDRALAITYKENGQRQWEWFRGGELDTSPIPGGKLAYYDHQWFHKWRGRIPDDELNRKAGLMYRYTMEAQLNYDALAVRESSRVARRINTFAPEVEGQQIKVSEARRRLSVEPSAQKREQIWRALDVTLGRANFRDVKRLIKHRNRVAREWGYRNFYQAWLSANGLDPREIDMLIGEIEERTRLPYLDRFAGGSDDPSGIAPWDIPYLNHEFRVTIAPYLGGEDLLGRVESTLEDMGFRQGFDGITIDSNERPGRSAHYFTFVVEIPDDVRVLITPGRGLDPYRLSSHEFGHALYYREVRQPDFIYRLPGCDAWSEGLAKTLERLPYRQGWLTRYCGVPENTAAAAASYNHADELVKIRRFLALHKFEKAIYEDPGCDFSDVYWSCLWEYQAVRPEAEPVWASHIHLVSQPLSSLWYIMARLIQSQIHRGMREQLGQEFGTPEAGRFMREHLYEPGSSRHWRELLKEATGQNLSAEPYLEDELGLSRDGG